MIFLELAHLFDLKIGATAFWGVSERFRLGLEQRALLIQADHLGPSWRVKKALGFSHLHWARFNRFDRMISRVMFDEIPISSYTHALNYFEEAVKLKQTKDNCELCRLILYSSIFYLLEVSVSGVRLMVGWAAFELGDEPRARATFQAVAATPDDCTSCVSKEPALERLNLFKSQAWAGLEQLEHSSFFSKLF